MLPRNKLLKQGLIYVILDKRTIDKYKLDILKLADKLSYVGVDILQLRFIDETDIEILNLAIELTKIIHKRNKIFIVNNRADIAYLAKADGIHLGTDDIDTKEARSILGTDKIIGRTVHSSRELKTLNNKEADYLSVGPVFKTTIKPQLKPITRHDLHEIAEKTDKPLFAIGGIELNNIYTLIENKIRNISLCRGVILRKDINNTVKELKKCLNTHS